MTTTTLLPQKANLSSSLLQRLADQQKMREYARELRDMRERVREQPYMFEQVKQVSGTTERLFGSERDKFLQNHVCYRQKNAKAQAEQMFRNKLKKYGITELFIQQHGEGNEEEASSSRLKVSADESDSRASRYAKGEFLGMFFV